MIALIAHDKKKAELVDFVQTHLEYFWKTPTVATGGTGALLNKDLNLNVECVAHGPEGGDLIIGSRIALGEIHALVFFRDPLTAQPHEPDITALMRVCDVHNIPLATNAASAEALIGWMEQAQNRCR